MRHPAKLSNIFDRIHKTHDVYKDIAEDLETRFDTSNEELECNSIDRPLRKNKKVTGLIKDK